MSNKVRAVVPARGWYAVFKDKETDTESKVRVEAWVAVTTVLDDEPYESWRGLGIWLDGPSYFEDFADFQGYEPKAGWDR